jgi:chitosanase
MLTIRGNTDGQNETSYGHLSAYHVPWIVVPDSFVHQHQIPPNAISVVICGGQMFYAILGDTNKADPEVIGEGSILLGQTCFPDEPIDGRYGHVYDDVLCISRFSTFVDCRHCFFDGI